MMFANKRSTYSRTAGSQNDELANNRLKLAARGRSGADALRHSRVAA
jgi:hypothetical protein